MPSPNGMVTDLTGTVDDREKDQLNAQTKRLRKADVMDIRFLLVHSFEKNNSGRLAEQFLEKWRDRFKDPDKAVVVVCGVNRPAAIGVAVSEDLSVFSKEIDDEEVGPPFIRGVFKTEAVPFIQKGRPVQGLSRALEVLEGVFLGLRQSPLVDLNHERDPQATTYVVNTLNKLNKAKTANIKLILLPTNYGVDCAHLALVNFNALLKVMSIGKDTIVAVHCADNPEKIFYSRAKQPSVDAQKIMNLLVKESNTLAGKGPPVKAIAAAMRMLDKTIGPVGHYRISSNPPGARLYYGSGPTDMVDLEIDEAPIKVTSDSDRRKLENAKFVQLRMDGYKPSALMEPRADKRKDTYYIHAEMEPISAQSAKAAKKGLFMPIALTTLGLIMFLVGYGQLHAHKYPWPAAMALLLAGLVLAVCMAAWANGRQEVIGGGEAGFSISAVWGLQYMLYAAGVVFLLFPRWLGRALYLYIENDAVTITKTTKPREKYSMQHVGYECSNCHQRMSTQMDRCPHCGVVFSGVRDKIIHGPDYKPTKTKTRKTGYSSVFFLLYFLLAGYCAYVMLTGCRLLVLRGQAWLFWAVGGLLVGAMLFGLALFYRYKAKGGRIERVTYY
ncbi:MAG: TPM domain-containing protein [Desulfarculaceae bacterium]